jgi:4-amino-4-deoxy-L-arabinose transferase-like glycosyltransferase
VTPAVDDPVAPYPWRAVLFVDAGVIALLIAVAPRYGWHRDELYFLEAGQHLAWGYIDQPPFTPFIARIAHELAPGNLVLLRSLPAVATTITVGLGAAIVREMGGSTRAQAMGAACVAGGGFVLGVGHLLSTAVFDLTAWMALLWLVTRLLRTADPRWWAAFGAVAGLSMLNKNLLVLLGLSVLAGLVAERHWPLLNTPWLIGGALLALALASPNLAWQADHGWPQADMAETLSARLATENRVTLIPLTLLFVGPLLVWVVVAGARWLGRASEARPQRVLLWAWPACLLLTFSTGGRPYYALPFTIAMMLAGVASLDEPQRLDRLRTFVLLNAVVSIPLALPLLPTSSARVSATVNEAVAETVGWPELVDQVAAVVDDLPAEERSSVVLLTGSYGEAGAIDRFGPARGLPPAYSGHNSYADFRRPADADATVVAIRYRLQTLEPHFDRCEEVATVDNGRDIENEVQGTPIIVCRGLLRSWPETWDRLRHLS